MLKKIFVTLLGIFLGFTFLVIGLLSIAILIAYPQLPSLDEITNYSPKMPLMIYSKDGQLIGVYGEERRSFISIDQFPDNLKNAVLAAEDKRFYDHWGVDLIGVARAALSNFRSGKIESGASTITQQVARTFFLTNERSFKRKFYEALMAYKIERSLTKDQILELYFNQIYLGQRAYGFKAASHAYFNKPVQELSLAEASMLAGLPKAPSAFNPIVNPKRAKIRQKYILDNMLELKMISLTEHQEALNKKLHYEQSKLGIKEDALYVAEMIRQEMYKKYGEEAYTRGFRVYATVNYEDQVVATQSLRSTLRSKGTGKFMGAESFIDIQQIPEDRLDEKLDQYISSLHAVGNMLPAIVTEVNRNSLTLLIQGEENPVTLTGKSISFVANAINNSKFGNQKVQVGSVLRVIKTKNGWSLTQIPELQGAIVSIDAKTGAIKALVGGYDFYQKEFNRATHALRQPGSSFKPFVYSAAIERGVTASTLINDTPISLPGLGPKGGVWEPKNSDGKYNGLMTVHQALVSSKNMVSIRLMMAIGTDYTHQYIRRFGFDAKNHPKSLSLSLGAGAVTPLEMARAYAVFANGGYRVAPYIIDHIEDSNGNVLARTEPLVAKKNAPQAIDSRNAFIMYQIMKDVTRRGTAYKAYANLKRNDIAGKTGTTNDHKDTWFVGYTPSVVTAVYVGYDKPRSMGKEFGSTLALPIWINYMKHALSKIPQENTPTPARVVQKDGEFYYVERQQTNPNLIIDNRGPETDEGEELVPIDDIVNDIMQQGSTNESNTHQPQSRSENLENLF